VVAGAGPRTVSSLRRRATAQQGEIRSLKENVGVVQPVVAVAPAAGASRAKLSRHPVAWGTHEREDELGPIESLGRPTDRGVKQVEQVRAEDDRLRGKLTAPAAEG